MEESLGAKSETLQKLIKAFNEKHRTDLALPGSSSRPGATNVAATTTRAGSNATNRTLCQPVFVPPDAPVDFLKTYAPTVTLLQSEFESQELLWKTLRTRTCSDFFIFSIHLYVSLLNLEL